MVWYMDNVNELVINTVTNEVSLDVDVFHVHMPMRVMGTGDSTLVIAKECGGHSLGETQFGK